MRESLQLSIEGGEQTRFAVGELFVERAPRHTRLLTHTTHRQSRDTVLAHDFTDGEQQATALHLGDMGALTDRLRRVPVTGVGASGHHHIP